MQAILYDAPVLQHYASHDGAGRVQVVGKTIQPEQYAIALPPEGPYRRAIDQTLPQLMADGTYDRLYQRWFGGVASISRSMGPSVTTSAVAISVPGMFLAATEANSMAASLICLLRVARAASS